MCKRHPIIYGIKIFYCPIVFMFICLVLYKSPRYKHSTRPTIANVDQMCFDNKTMENYHREGTSLPDHLRQIWLPTDLAWLNYKLQALSTLYNHRFDVNGAVSTRFLHFIWSNHNLLEEPKFQIRIDWEFCCESWLLVSS